MREIMDHELEKILEKEQNRQKNSAVFIASENYASESVRKYTSSILTNKYAEGYPGARYYAGCEYVDQIENLIRDLKRNGYIVNKVKANYGA